MALNPSFVGRRYGPFTYEVGVEKLREFAYAVGGGVPSLAFAGNAAPEGLLPVLYDQQAAAQSPHGAVVAMPSFAVVFAIAPFSAAIMDPALELNVMMLVHGEQEFEFLEVVKAGDVLTTTGEITRAVSKAGKEFLTVTSESTNQHGRPVVRGVWTAVIRG